VSFFLQFTARFLAGRHLLTRNHASSIVLVSFFWLLPARIVHGPRLTRSTRLGPRLVFLHGWNQVQRTRVCLECVHDHGRRASGVFGQDEPSSAFPSFCGLLCLSLNVAAFAHSPQVINFMLLERQTRWKNSHSTPFAIQGSQPNGPTATSDTVKEFPEQWFTQPVDHFSQDSPTFKQRYWFNERHYVSGTNGPVIVIDGGETSGEDRLPYLDIGLAEILAKATGGIGVVLEHRYVCVKSPWTTQLFRALLTISSQVLWFVYPGSPEWLGVMY
jgi:hypothetical protein